MYNQLTPEQVERLDLLKKQADALTLIVGNIQRYGYSAYTPYMSGPDNRGKLEAVLGDLNAIVVQLARANDIDDGEVLAHMARRTSRIEDLRKQQAHPH